MAYRVTLDGIAHRFDSLREVMACASPPRSGDVLAGIAAENEEQRVAAQWALSEIPLPQFLNEPLIPVVTRTRNGGGRFQADARSGHDLGRFQMRRDHRLS